MGLVLACGLIVERGRGVLLWRRDDQWQIPGKIMERDETPQEAVSEGLGKRLGLDVWVGDIVCTAEFQQGSERVKAEVMTAARLSEDELEPLAPAIDQVDFFALNALEDLQREGKLSPAVEQLMRLIAREDLTLADLTP